MQDMMKQYGMGSDMFAGEGETLILNKKHPLVQFLQSRVVVNEKKKDAENANAAKTAEASAAAAGEQEAAGEPAEKTTADTAEPASKKPSLTRLVCEQLYDLARIQQGSLGADRMGAFVKRTNEIMCALTEEKGEKQ